MPREEPLQIPRQQRASTGPVLRRSCLKTRKMTAGRHQVTRRLKRTMTSCLQRAARYSFGSCFATLRHSCRLCPRPWQTHVMHAPHRPPQDILVPTAAWPQGEGLAGGPASKPARCQPSRTARPGAQMGRQRAAGGGTTAAAAAKTKRQPLQPALAPREAFDSVPSSGEWSPCLHERSNGCCKSSSFTALVSSTRMHVHGGRRGERGRAGRAAAGVRQEGRRQRGGRLSTARGRRNIAQRAHAGRTRSPEEPQVRGAGLRRQPQVSWQCSLQAVAGTLLTRVGCLPQKPSMPSMS